MKETRSIKSFDTLQYMASIISFPSPFNAIIEKFTILLDQVDSLKTVSKIEESLRKVALGLMSNSSVTPPQALIFIHGLFTSSTKIKQKLKGKYLSF